jgi:hypothetical protein
METANTAIDTVKGKPKRQCVIVVLDVQPVRQRELPQIGEARASVGCISSRQEGWEEAGSEYPNDGCDDEQFGDTEAAPSPGANAPLGPSIGNRETNAGERRPREAESTRHLFHGSDPSSVPIAARWLPPVTYS